MKELLKKSNEIYSLKSLVRFNPHFRIKDESVLEHLSITTLITLLLCEKIQCNREKAIIISLLHDIGEVKLGEISIGTKNRYKKFKEIVNETELVSFIDTLPQYLDYYSEYVEQKTIESKLVKLADIISVIIYTSTEVKLGNRYMRKLLIESISRYKYLCEKLNFSVNEDDLEVFY